MAAAKLTFRHAFLLLCISHSSVTSFSPLASVRLTPIRSLGPSKVLAPDSIITINYINTRTCPRRHHAEHRSTRLQLSSSASLSWVYMSLLALQFGIQPILTKKFTPKTITRTTVVLCQDIVKFLAATIFLWASGSWTTSLQGTLLASVCDCREPLIKILTLIHSHANARRLVSSWLVDCGRHSSRTICRSKLLCINGISKLATHYIQCS